MRFFDRFRPKPDDQALTSVYLPRAIGEQLTSNPQIASASAAYREPILQMTNRLPGFGAVHETQQLLWHAIRQYTPTVDACFANRRVLEGRPEIKSQDEALQAVLMHFLDTVPVGFLEGQSVQCGFSHYHEGLGNFTDEYGLAAGEIVLSEDAREIDRLVVPSPRTLELQKEAGTRYYSLWQSYVSGQGGKVRIDNAPLVQVLSFRAPVEGPWPPPLCWAAVKAAEGAMRVAEGGINGWWDSGNPSRVQGWAFDKEAKPTTVATTYTNAEGKTETEEVPVAVLSLKTAMEAVAAQKRMGHKGDAFVYSRGAEFINEVLGPGSDALVKLLREHASYFEGQLVTLSQTPIWMYPHLIPGRGDGLGSHLANAEAKIFSTAARDRSMKIEPLIRQILDLFLILQGDARWVGKYDIEWTSATIIDAEAEAAARLKVAEAAAKEIDNVVQLYEDDGSRRWGGEAEAMLEDAGIYRAA